MVKSKKTYIVRDGKRYLEFVGTDGKVIFNDEFRALITKGNRRLYYKGMDFVPKDFRFKSGQKVLVSSRDIVVTD